MNEDTNSEKFGLPGICNAVEDTIVARDILIAKDTGCTPASLSLFYKRQ